MRLSPVSVSKKPRIHRKISNPNGPDPLGFSFYSLQILLDPVHGRNPVHGLEGCEEDGIAFEAGARGDLLQIKQIMSSRIYFFRTAAIHFF